MDAALSFLRCAGAVGEELGLEAVGHLRKDVFIPKTFANIAIRVFFNFRCDCNIDSSFANEHVINAPQFHKRSSDSSQTRSHTLLLLTLLMMLLSRSPL